MIYPVDSVIHPLNNPGLDSFLDINGPTADINRKPEADKMSILVNLWMRIQFLLDSLTFIFVTYPWNYESFLGRKEHTSQRLFSSCLLSSPKCYSGRLQFTEINHAFLRSRFWLFACFKYQTMDTLAHIKIPGSLAGFRNKFSQYFNRSLKWKSVGPETSVDESFCDVTEQSSAQAPRYKSHGK